MKTFNKSILSMFALATVVMASCSDNDTWNEENGPDPSKELISFSSQDGQIGTRAVFEGTRAGLHSSNNTKIVMRIKAEDSETTSGHTKEDSNRYTRIVATASKEKNSNECHSDLNNDHSDITFVEGNYRYWDDAFGRYSKLSVYAVAVPGKDDANVLSDNILTDTNSSPVSSINQKWFTETTENEKTTAWSLPLSQNDDNIANKDLCYSNNISVKGKGGVIRYKFTSENTWKFDKIADGQLQWTAKSDGSTIGKFDQGNLIFKHALCKVTINLTEAVGKGFDNNSNADFKFKENTNVELLNFPYESILDLATGEWDETKTNCKKGNFTKLHETTKNPSENKTVRTVTGLTLPGKTLYGITDNALHFIIDDNDYYVTCDQIANAIRDYYTTNSSAKGASELQNFTTMEQGKHYVINLTIGKTKIENITAQLIGWEEVNSANIDPTNAYIKVNLKSSSSNVTTYESNNANNFNLYRSANTADLETGTDYNDKYNQKSFYDWKTGYETTDASKEWKAENSSGHWDTGWYWPDNMTYYHIRAVGDNTSTSPLCPNVTIDATNGDYFSIKSGNITGTDYRDYIWGAPFKQTDDKLSYSIKNGFDGTTSENNSDSHQIYKAIGATNDVINMLFFHMTAQVFFNITTTTGDNRVTLRSGTESSYTQTKVEILRFFKDGTVRVGNGCVEPVTNETSAFTNNQEVEFEEYTPESVGTAAISKHRYGVVPQTLNRESGTNTGNEYKVGLRITTPDGNQYVIEDISTVYASTVTDNNIKNPYQAETSGSDTKYKINRWYPGYKYTYTIRITKKGIDKITAQLLDWETVKSDDIDIDLEGK